MNDRSNQLDAFVPAYVRAIDPYVAGRPIDEVARELGLDPARIVKLASNENPLGIPSSAQEAIRATASGAGRYPDSNGFELKAALATRWGVGADWLTLGNGSNDVLELAARATLERSSSAVFAQHSFMIYGLVTQAIGARSIVVAATPGLGHDLAAMLESIGADTRIVFVANPNNPTGTLLLAPEIEAFLDAVPSRVMVVLDEAYNEYLEPSLQADSVAWVKRYPNLVVMRTFSKAFGLAGLRVGYAISQPHVADILNRIRQPFNVGVVALAAAQAALADHEFLERTFALNAAGYRQLQQGFTALGLEYIPSSGNFVLVKVGDDDGAGARVNRALLKQGVIVRPVASYGLPRWLRVSIGLPEENEQFLRALPGALASR